MMEAASTSETSVNFYHTTQRNNPEGVHLHTHHHENLKSHKTVVGISAYEFARVNSVQKLKYWHWIDMMFAANCKMLPH
jgi:hypothetical protein